MACYVCDARQTDPVKGKSPWARLVVGGEQVLICPDCQGADPAWKAKADGCPSCGSTHLVIVMGTIACKACGHEFERTS